ncbi:MAG: exo-alpha-sialidase [Clostridia bacterium]|nr:exo-alpha-sialidase [Clostridia bacterium]
MKVLSDKIIYAAGENGFCHNRIPGIVVCDDGTMLVYYECRMGRNDWSVSEIGMKKSIDGGKTWSEEVYIASGEGKNTVNNPVMAVMPDGKIVFVWLENYKRPFCKFSCDKGETWTERVEIIDAFEEFRPDYAWTVAATGPGHGTVTKDGRIVLTVWLTSNITNIFAHHPSVAATMVSDDGGVTWHRGDILPITEVPDPNEACMAETSRGLFMNIRNVSDKKRRYIAVSPDGVSGWHDLHIADNLIDPICAAGMTAKDDVLYFSNCRSTEGRVNVSLSRSADFGETWESVLLNESGGYSDVCVNPMTGTAFVVYESQHENEIRVAEVEIS